MPTGGGYNHLIMQRPTTARVVLQAASGKLNLAALSTVFALALLSGQLGLLLAGACLYTLLIARDASDPRFWRRMMAAEAAARRELPETSTLSEEALRVVVSSLRSGYREIAFSLKRTPEPIKVHVRVALSTLADLRAHAAQLVRDADDLHRYLCANPRAAVEAEIKRLRESLERAADDARVEYQKALSVRQEQLDTIDRIKHEHDRLLASLELTVAMVDAFPSRVHRLRLLETSAKQDLVSEVDEELERMEGDLSSSRRLLEGLAQRPEELMASGDPAR